MEERRETEWENEETRLQRSGVGSAVERGSVLGNSRDHQEDCFRIDFLGETWQGSR